MKKRQRKIIKNIISWLGSVIPVASLLSVVIDFTCPASGQHLSKRTKITGCFIFKSRNAINYRGSNNSSLKSQNRENRLRQKNIGKSLFSHFYSALIDFSSRSELHKGLKDIQKDQDALNKYTIKRQLTLTANNKNDSGASQALLGKLRSNGEAHVSKLIKDRFRFIDDLQGGVNVKLKLGFWKEDTKRNIEPAPLKYGLVLKNIEPASESVLYAAQGTFDPAQLDNAPKATTSWEIKPINDSNNRRFFSRSIANTSFIADSADSSPDLFDRLSELDLPDPDFDLKAAPVSSVDKHLAAKRGGMDSSSMLAMKLSLRQEEGLYKLDYFTQERNDANKYKHNFMMPLYSGLSLSQERNGEFAMVRTSLHNVLFMRHMPTLNLHYLPIENKYNSDLDYKVENHHITFKSEIPMNSHNPSKYEVAYSSSF